MSDNKRHVARYLIPLALFLVLIAFFYVGLHHDPRLVPSPLVGKQAPAFQMESVLDPAKTLSEQEFRNQKVSLFNVWASWCVSCRQEHPFLVELSKTDRVTIYGLNYKDTRQDAEGWLNVLGNPYKASVFDEKGTVGIDYGVYGVPETFVVDQKGVIRHKHVGPITPEVWQNELLPLVEKLEQEAG